MPPAPAPPPPANAPAAPAAPPVVPMLPPVPPAPPAPPAPPLAATPPAPPAPAPPVPSPVPAAPPVPTPPLPAPATPAPPDASAPPTPAVPPAAGSSGAAVLLQARERPVNKGRRATAGRVGLLVMAVSKCPDPSRCFAYSGCRCESAGRAGTRHVRCAYRAIARLSSHDRDIIVCRTPTDGFEMSEHDEGLDSSPSGHRLGRGLCSRSLNHRYESR